MGNMDQVSKESEEKLSKEEIGEILKRLRVELEEYAKLISQSKRGTKEKSPQQDVIPFSHQEDQAYQHYLKTKLEIKKYEKMLDALTEKENK